MDVSIQSAGSTSASNAMSGASAPMSPSRKMSNLFEQIDTSGTGTITKSQFEQAFQSMNPPASTKAAGADALWSQLDPNGTGQVTKADFTKGMTTAMKQVRGGHHHHSSSAAGAQQLAQGTSSLDALGGSGSTSGTSFSGSSVGTFLNTLA